LPLMTLRYKYDSEVWALSGRPTDWLAEGPSGRAARQRPPTSPSVVQSPRIVGLPVERHVEGAGSIAWGTPVTTGVPHD